MSRTANFAKELVDQLNVDCKHFAPWRIGTVPGQCTARECVDVESTGGKTKILIEVELRRSAPAMNVLKVWRWIDQGWLRAPRVVLVQAFSTHYRKKDDFRRTNAIFLGEQMMNALADRFGYLCRDFEYRPYKKRDSVSATEGGGAMKRAARNLAHIIGSDLYDEVRLDKLAAEMKTAAAAASAAPITTYGSIPHAGAPPNDNWKSKTPGANKRDKTFKLPSEILKDVT